jgi:hypothetical protein
VVVVVVLDGDGDGDGDGDDPDPDPDTRPSHRSKGLGGLSLIVSQRLLRWVWAPRISSRGAPIALKQAWRLDR